MKKSIFLQNALPSLAFGTGQLTNPQLGVPSRYCLLPAIGELVNHIICLKNVVNRKWGDPRLAEELRNVAYFH